MDERRLFDIQAAAERLKKLGAGAATKNFVRTLISTGQLAHLKIGRKFYVSAEAIELWITRRARLRK